MVYPIEGKDIEGKDTMRNEKDRKGKQSVTNAGNNLPKEKAKTYYELFSEAKEANKNGIALVFESDVKYTYQQLSELVGSHSAYLKATCLITPFQRVGVYLSRSPKQLITRLALSQLGAIYVPIDSVNPKKRTLDIMEDCQIEFLISEEKCESTVREFLSELSVGSHLCDTKENDKVYKLAWNNEKDFEWMKKGDPICYIMYSSGTTGKPKGIPIFEKRGIAAWYELLKEKFAQDLGHEQRKILGNIPVGFDAHVWEDMMAWAARGTLCLTNDEQHRDDKALAQWLSDCKVTDMTVMPDKLRLLWNMRNTGGIQYHFKDLYVTGAACPPEFVRELVREGITFDNSYGPTEATFGLTMWPITHPNQVKDKVPIGPFLGPGNVTGYIAKKSDDENDYELVEKNNEGHYEGELIIVSDYLMPRYLHRDEKQSFVTIIVNGEVKRGFATGDLFHGTANTLDRDHDKDTFYCVGRIGLTIRLNGFWINLKDIEDCLKVKFILLDQRLKPSQLMLSEGQRKKGNEVYIWKEGNAWHFTGRLYGKFKSGIYQEHGALEEVAKSKLSENKTCVEVLMGENKGFFEELIKFTSQATKMTLIQDVCLTDSQAKLETTSLTHLAAFIQTQHTVTPEDLQSYQQHVKNCLSGLEVPPVWFRIKEVKRTEKGHVEQAWRGYFKTASEQRFSTTQQNDKNVVTQNGEIPTPELLETAELKGLKQQILTIWEDLIYDTDDHKVRQLMNAESALYEQKNGSMLHHLLMEMLFDEKGKLKSWFEEHKLEKSTLRTIRKSLYAISEDCLTINRIAQTFVLASRYKKAWQNYAESDHKEKRNNSNQQSIFFIHPLTGVIDNKYQNAFTADFTNSWGLTAPYIQDMRKDSNTNESEYLLSDDLDQMAENAAKGLLAIKPQGRYQLVGWSFGGLLALKMAYYLYKMGKHHVTDLFLIDTPEPNGLEKLSPEKRTYYIQSAIKEILKCDLPNIPAFEESISITDQIEIIFDLAALSIETSSEGNKAEEWKKWKVMKHHLLAVAKWRNPSNLLPSCAKIHLIMPSTKRADVPGANEEAWAAWIKEQWKAKPREKPALETHPIGNCDHFSIIETEELRKLLRERLKVGFDEELIKGLKQYFKRKSVELKNLTIFDDNKVNAYFLDNTKKRHWIASESQEETNQLAYQLSFSREGRETFNLVISLDLSNYNPESNSDLLNWIRDTFKSVVKGDANPLHQDIYQQITDRGDRRTKLLILTHISKLNNSNDFDELRKTCTVMVVSDKLPKGIKDIVSISEFKNKKENTFKRGDNVMGSSDDEKQKKDSKKSRSGKKTSKSRSDDRGESSSSGHSRRSRDERARQSSRNRKRDEEEGDGDLSSPERKSSDDGESDRRSNSHTHMHPDSPINAKGRERKKEKSSTKKRQGLIDFSGCTVIDFHTDGTSEGDIKFSNGTKIIYAKHGAEPTKRSEEEITNAIKSTPSPYSTPGSSSKK